MFKLWNELMYEFLQRILKPFYEEYTKDDDSDLRVTYES